MECWNIGILDRNASFHYSNTPVLRPSRLTRTEGFLIIQIGCAKVSFCEETNMLKPIAMTEGHYECRSLDETLLIFTDLLALEVVERKDKEAVVKHPNTKWRLVVHEGGPDAPNK